MPDADAVLRRKHGKAEAFKKWRKAHPDGAKAWNKRNPDKVLYKSLLVNNRARAARDRDMPFLLTYQEFSELVRPMVCSVTGIPLVWNGGPWAPSVDRVRNDVGYQADNVRLVCWIYNRARGSGTDEDVMRVALALVEGVAR